MKLAFVILNYNDYPSTKTLLDNIKDYTVLSLIVVVDNCSKDDSFERLKPLENEKIKVIRTLENKGYASGLNFGSRYAIEQLGPCHIILSNADIIIQSEKDLLLLNQAIEKHHIGVLAPCIRQNNTISRGWKVPSMTTEILGNLPVIGQKIYQKKIAYQKRHYEEDLSIVGAVSGCFFMITSKALEEIGFLDTQTFLYYEEYILAKKLEKTSYQIAVLNQVEVIHNHSVSIDKSLNRVKKFKALKKSQAYFCKKYLKAKWWQLFFLQVTKELTLGLLYVRSMLHLK